MISDLETPAWKCKESSTSTLWQNPTDIRSPIKNKDGSITSTFRRLASVDGKGNTFKIKQDWVISAGGYTCSSGCKEVTSAWYSDWVVMSITELNFDKSLSLTTSLIGFGLSVIILI